MARQAFQWWVPLTAVAVLASMEGWKLSLPDPSVGEPFRKEVAMKVNAWPRIVGEWEGTDAPLPQEAIALLHTTAYICREYVSSVTHKRVWLLFMNVEDSRDMMGHYPPNCYPGNGWVLKSSTPETWVVDGLSIPGYEYAFTKDEHGQELLKTARDFFLLSDGKFYPEIGSFGRAASDFYLRPYGATQVQVIFNGETEPEEREEIFQSIIKAHRGLIDAVIRKEH